MLKFEGPYVQLTHMTHSITLYEGRYHQLRRMLAAIGNRAVSIKRYQTGPLHLGDLPVGHWRELTKEELDAILNI